jgi:hypothetical protein
MIFCLLIIHNYDRISSITRVPHAITWDYFTTYLPDRFIHSPKEVMEAIVTDINDLMQDFWRTSSDVGAPFFAMSRLLEILQVCVCFDITSVFVTAVDLNDKNLQKNHDLIGAKLKSLLDGYRKMFDHSMRKSKYLGDNLRFLPGVVVQKNMSVQGMADLYRIKPDLLERLIKSTIDPLTGMGPMTWNPFASHAHPHIG